MSHYDTLGVKPDATLDEIKRAFRERSSKAHPDKGGSSEEQARLNQAYEVLSDPERRKRHDESGLDAPRDLQDTARQIAMEYLAKALIEAHGDPIVHALDGLNAQRLDAEATWQKTSTMIKRLETRRSRITVASGDNLALPIIDQQLPTLRLQLAKVQEFLAIAEIADELLNRHAYQEPEGAFATAYPAKAFHLHGTTTNSSGGGL